MRINVDITFDLDAKHLVLASNANAESNSVIAAYTDNEYLFRMNIFNDPPTKLDMTNVTSFKLGIGLLNATTPMVESDNTEFNVFGDWAETNVAAGLISCRVDTNSATLEAWLANAEWKQCYCEVKATDPIGDSTIALFPITIKNTLYDA